MTLSSLWSWAAGWLGAGRASRRPCPHQPEPHRAPASRGSGPGPGSNAAAATLAGAAPPRQPKAALVVRVTDLDRAVVVSLDGEASTDNLQPLELALARVLVRRLPLAVLDCSALTLLSSLAMGLLVGLRRDLGRWQGCVKLAGVGPLVEQALQATRLIDLFEVHATVEQALAAAAVADVPLPATALTPHLILDRR
jgi:anti-sigma B factor antagonist